MKQQINFFDRPKKRKASAFSGMMFVQLFASYFAILIFVYAGAVWQKSTQEKVLDELEAKKKQVISELQAEVKKREAMKTAELKSKEEIEAEIAKLQSYAQAKLVVINAIKDRSKGSADGFSDFFEGFSVQHTAGVSLSSFEIAKGGTFLALTGSAVHSKLVPSYLESLGEVKAFDGRTFEIFQLDREETEEKSLIKFKVQTTKGK